MQLCSHQLNVMKRRGGNCLFEDKDQDGSVTQPRRGTPHGVVEMPARGLLRTQNQVAGATEMMDGSLLRAPSCPGSCPEELGVPSTCRGTLLRSYSAFPWGARDQEISSQP